MSKKTVFIIIYLAIGIFFYVQGFVPAGTILEQVFTFFYITLLWPIAIGANIIFG